MAFIASHPVFRLDEFREAHVASGQSPQSSASILRYHVREGRIASVRNGVYAALGPVDPWLLGSRLTSDAVIAYDGALSLHGLAPLGHQLSYVSMERLSPFHFNEVVYRGLRPPASVASGFGDGDGVEVVERGGLPVKTTTRERTLVDLLDRLDLAPPLEVLAPLFDRDRAGDVGQLVSWALRLRHPVTTARLGVLLLRNPLLTKAQRKALLLNSPRSPSHFQRAAAAEDDVFLGEWNLVVPRSLLSW